MLAFSGAARTSPQPVRQVALAISLAQSRTSSHLAASAVGTATPSSCIAARSSARLSSYSVAGLPASSRSEGTSTYARGHRREVGQLLGRQVAGAEAQQGQAQRVDAHVPSVHECPRADGRVGTRAGRSPAAPGRTWPSSGLGVGRSGRAVVLVGRRPVRAVPSDPSGRAACFRFLRLSLGPPGREPRVSEQREACRSRDSAPAGWCGRWRRQVQNLKRARPPSSGAELLLMLQWSGTFRRVSARVPVRQAFLQWVTEKSANASRSGLSLVHRILRFSSGSGTQPAHLWFGSGSGPPTP